MREPLVTIGVASALPAGRNTRRTCGRGTIREIRWSASHLGMRPGLPCSPDESPDAFAIDFLGGRHAAGVELDRPDLIAAARAGAEHLLTVGINDDKGFQVPRIIPWAQRPGDEYAYSWCHGGPGTSLLFAALEYARVDQVGLGRPIISTSLSSTDSDRTIAVIAGQR